MTGPARPARKVSFDCTVPNVYHHGRAGDRMVCACILVHKVVDKHEPGVSLPNTNHVINRGLYRDI